MAGKSVGISLKQFRYDSVRPVGSREFCLDKISFPGEVGGIT